MKVRIDSRYLANPEYVETMTNAHSTGNILYGFSSSCLEIDLDDWNLEIDDMYGLYLVHSDVMIFFRNGYDCIESKEELALRCDLENPICINGEK